MFDPEKFIRQLDGALIGRQEANKHEQDEKEKKEKKKQRIAREGEETINSAVLELEGEVPIWSLLEVLKEKVSPNWQMRRWGPGNGMVARGFIYNKEGWDREGLVGEGRSARRVTIHEERYNSIGLILSYKNRFGILYYSLGSPEGEISMPGKYTDLNFKANSKGDLTKVARELTKFYVGLKTGKGNC